MSLYTIHISFLYLCRQLEHPCAKSLFQVRQLFGSEQGENNQRSAMYFLKNRLVHAHTQSRELSNLSSGREGLLNLSSKEQI